MAESRNEVRVKWWSRLRTRMGISYVVVTILAALLVEALILSVALFVITQTPMLAYFNLQRVGNAAQEYALRAVVEGGGVALNPNSTFAPGQEASLKPEQEPDHPRIEFLYLEVPYIQPGMDAPVDVAFALLIDPQGEVIASSYPEQYPPGMNALETLPAASAIIRQALEGRPDGDIYESPSGMYSFVAQTVRSREDEILGAMYVQAPAGIPRDVNLLGEVGNVLIPSSIGWLCLMLPLGLIFGILTTHGLIRRIERLRDATARFSDGDFSQRLRISRADEIGQLEAQFNVMAEQLVEGFAQRQALAEESARREERARFEQELLSAYYVQRSLLPENVPAIQGWRIDPFYRPARQVGGDLYDFLDLPGGRFGLVIGDGTGKGMPAALIMATTAAMIRAAAPNFKYPGEVLRLVNNLLQVHITPGMFVTCFYAILDPASGHLCFANAGHDIPYLSRSGEIHELRARGMPLGLMPEQSYAEEEMVIHKDDTILFYTDGLVEAHSAEGEMFGFPRLQNLLKNGSHADDFIDLLIRELESFTGPVWEQEDDITLVRVRKLA